MLLVVGSLLLFSSLSSEALVLGIIHFVVVDASASYLDGARSNAVHERSIVADDHDSLVALHEEVLQPLNRLDVEVVSRLVEQEHVGATQ